MQKNQYKIMYEVEDSHFWYQGMRRITRVILQAFLKKNTNQILDAGCGTGRNLIFLSQFGVVSGMDISTEALKFCRQRNLKGVKLGSIDKIPYDNNFFDLVTCFDVIGQKEVADVNKVFSEFNRVLKPGGILLIRVAAHNWLMGHHDKVVHTRHRYTAAELKKQAETAGLKILKISYANTFLFPIAALRRVLSKKLPIYKSDQSDVSAVNGLLNRLLYIPFILESVCLKYINLPIGLSVFGVFEKS